MSYYETSAEKSDYFFFEKRTVDPIPAHFHSRTELLIVETGTICVSVNGERRTLRRGDVCFCDGFSVHAYEDAKDLTAYVLLFDKTCFAGFASRYPDKTFPAFFTFDDFSLLDTLYRHYLSAPDKSLALTGVCTVLTAEFLKQVSPVPRIAGNGDALICRILDHIERRSEERITLASLSELCGYSREHISRTFSKYVGSLPQYVNRIRAQKAKALLAQGDKTVSETAFACGFESLNTFYRAYRAAFGISPKRTKKTP